MRNNVARRVARFLCSYNCKLRFAASPLAYAKHFRVCVNTRNNIVQLVVQHCCVASCRANVARITNSRAVNSFVAESRKSFYFVQQSRATKFRVVIRATFTLQLFAQEFHDFVLLVLEQGSMTIYLKRFPLFVYMVQDDELIAQKVARTWSFTRNQVLIWHLYC